MTQAATSPWTSIRLIAADIKLAHSVFAMPFALLAAFMAAFPRTSAPDWRQFAGQLLLIVVAMVFARTVAMLANRFLDREIDQRNPRTVNRAIPSGRLPASRAVSAILACAAGFLLVCAVFGIVYENWWPLILGPFVLIWISSYALLKRFTALCHLYLGSSLAMSPIAAAIAINPDSIWPAYAVFQAAIWLLSGMVLCWVAGFDVIYALQDVDIDRRDGLHSIPAKFGVNGALWISRVLHACALACLVECWRIDDRFAIAFGIGVMIVAALLTYEHLTVSRWGTTKIALAFFTLNGIISCVLGILGIIDITVL
jgi:4-hydroxybenzoate polyprenyltransferase